MAVGGGYEHFVEWDVCVSGLPGGAHTQQPYSGTQIGTGRTRVPDNKPGPKLTCANLHLYLLYYLVLLMIID